eukprot:2707156-Prymnesium_polylepis.2
MRQRRARRQHRRLLLCGEPLALQLLPVALESSALRLLAAPAIARVGQITLLLLSGRLVSVGPTEQLPLLPQLLLDVHRRSGSISDPRRGSLPT